MCVCQREREEGSLEWVSTKLMWSHNKFKTVRAVALKTDMATKIIYFTVNGRPEQAEFPVDCPAQDVKGRQLK